MIDLQVVDAFADRPFAGNPAAVAVLDHYPPDWWLQAVAQEMNLSETAFVVPRRAREFDLRWFSPAAEVDLCGHATLATAHVVGPGRFHTRSGVLTCDRVDSDLLEMDFPADLPVATSAPELSGTAAFIGQLEGGRWARGRFDLLVEVVDAEAVRRFQPDLGAVAELDCRCLIVTAPADQTGYDCISRVFAPSVGIAEDPVTGSAHCTLAGYWQARTGRSMLVGYQASARGGTVRMRVAGDRVFLQGRAVTVSQVRLLVEPTGG